MHTDKLILRFLVSVLPCGLIVVVLQDFVQIWACADVGLEATLTSALRDNPEDWTARRKLRLAQLAKSCVVLTFRKCCVWCD